MAYKTCARTANRPDDCNRRKSLSTLTSQQAPPCKTHHGHARLRLAGGRRDEHTISVRRDHGLAIIPADHRAGVFDHFKAGVGRSKAERCAARNNRTGDFQCPLARCIGLSPTGQQVRCNGCVQRPRSQQKAYRLVLRYGATGEVAVEATFNQQ